MFTGLGLDNCSAGALKDTPERKTNRMLCERGRWEGVSEHLVWQVDVEHVLLAPALSPASQPPVLTHD